MNQVKLSDLSKGQRAAAYFIIICILGLVGVATLKLGIAIWKIK